MKKMINIWHITNDNADKFHDAIVKAVKALQDRNLEVEIQYQTGRHYNSILYTAIITGYEVKS